MAYTSTGTLSVISLLANGALPLENTLIHIRGGDEENRFVEFSLLTDRDGVTGSVELPAPDRALSLSPSAPEQPYASYDVMAYADGYYPKTVRGVAVFSGVDAVLPIYMIPKVDGEPYPRGNLYGKVVENPNLE